MKIEPSGVCNDADFLRRVYLDLTGLPPSAEDVRVFLADTHPVREKRDAIIDKLIGDEVMALYLPMYGGFDEAAPVMLRHAAELLRAAGYGGEQPPFADVKDRMLFAEALETAKCFEEGVIESSAAANIGSIMGIGFPPNTGGAAQFMTGYEAADGRIGLTAFLDRADELAETYGDRFRPTAYLRDLAASPAELERLAAKLAALETTVKPFDGRGVPTGARFVKPELVAEVRFTEWTGAGRIRHPAYLGLRTDKSPAEITRE